jgi:hypothetical protein
MSDLKPMPTPERQLPSEAYERFKQSMITGYDEWHDGVGYDLDAFDALRPDERERVVSALREKGKGALDWRDMEVLGRENSTASFDRLRDELIGGSVENRARALDEINSMGRMTPSVFDHKLGELLDDVTDEDGVTQTLLLVGDDPGPKTRAALERGMRDRPDVALHFASQLLDLAGLSDDMAAFDPKFRPTLLKLLPDEPDDVRAAAVRQVLAWLDGGGGISKSKSKRKK